MNYPSMTTRICFLVLLGLTTPLLARAHWGATFDECVKRYGKARKTRKQQGRVAQAVFVTEDLRITVRFKGGTAHFVAYSPPAGDRLDTDAVMGILQRYEQGPLRFQPVSTYGPGGGEAKLTTTKHREQLRQSIEYQTFVRSDNRVIATLVRKVDTLKVYSMPADVARATADEGAGTQPDKEKVWDETDTGWNPVTD